MNTNAYLTKNFKGRNIESLEDFLFSLDANYDWKSFLISLTPKSKKFKPKFYYVYLNNETYSLVLVSVHPISKVDNQAFVQFKVDGNEVIIRKSNFYLIERVFSKELKQPLEDFDDILLEVEEVNY